MPIRVLEPSVAAQIAAGEVVERPASVVKELVENAIDAGARHVRVELEQGGKTLVRVSDDGHGMGREDALLALDRHATSKIKSSADLVGIHSFGFRGEALPAIASVSRLALVSAEEDGQGTEVAVTGGRIDQVTAAARQRGTTITVRALFFNTPARRKFLRSVSSESRLSGDAVTILALAHPQVGFELVADERSRLHLPAGQPLADRLVAVWGRDVAGSMIPVSHGVGTVRVEGFIQRPGDAKPTGRRTQLLVNGRPFKDNFLLRAAEAGYRSAIHPGDRPSLFLNILLVPGDVDVNVHPAKLEVRFRERPAVERAVEEAVRHALGTLAAAAPVGEWRPLPVPPRPSGSGEVWAEPTDAETDADASASVDQEVAPRAPHFAPPELPLETPASAPSDPFAGPVWQMFQSYICYEGPDGLVIVDQHSAQERVLYEEVMTRIKAGGLPAQQLLLPATVELTDEELDVVEAHREELARVGFEAEPFGGRTVVLHAVPNPHPRFDAITCFRELVADLARGRFGGWANRLERFAATFACRAAVKAGQPLGDREMRELLGRLLATQLPPHDVHGRSTIVQLPKEELERRFGRR
ncbi:MAG: DNA mismatch repair endonuclease MutL [Gemmatimonadetes bacterium]|nr:DNA mismatch repair endonuclease MutL [Gemmatimonadota bacterium]